MNGDPWFESGLFLGLTWLFKFGLLFAFFFTVKSFTAGDDTGKIMKFLIVLGLCSFIAVLCGVSNKSGDDDAPDDENHSASATLPETDSDYKNTEAYLVLLLVTSGFAAHSNRKPKPTIQESFDR